MSGYPSTAQDTQFETTMNISFADSAKMQIIQEEEIVGGKYSIHNINRNKDYRRKTN
jgi:DNA gyrase inhibitor GyrI